ncbi:nicotinamide riboside transporter PnuC [Myroides sp. LJL119]
MYDFFFGNYNDTAFISIFLELVVFLFGILSVWYAGRQNILVFPTGIIATVISVYLLYLAGYLGDMLLNVYYSCMSIYGWFMWSVKSNEKDKVLKVSLLDASNMKYGLFFFILTILLVYIVYLVFQVKLEFVNYVDMLTSGIFLTAMYYMALKKVESWIFWIIGDIISIPLYAYRGLGIISLQFVVFTIISAQGYLAWRKALLASRS